MSLSDKACVSGVGETVYMRGLTKSALELQLEASLKAIEDAGLDPKDIDGVIPIGIVSGTAEDFIDDEATDAEDEVEEVEAEAEAAEKG